ncbi:MAG: hypothetical protein KJ718_00045 [Nanoarchaeota archaeon]|nr:hypothetical protein [Nanoarchaeota archaeon]MBU1050932.1 hypothetical protein [Nanoarchaeota archaeon]MBU1988471.1 hypothetical protein [Nanoarchaeota archaeon]
MIENPFGISKDMVLEVLRESSKAMHFFTKEFKEKYDVKLSGKIQSETFSNLLEQIASKIFTERLGYDVKKATSDNNPDLTFTKINLPMEIKVTSGQVWRGGEFSKRASWHLMVSRNEEFNEFFVCLVDMQKGEGLWISAMQQGKNYYAPSFKKDQIYQIKDKIPIFVGDVIKTSKGTIKLKREKV